MAKPFKGVIKLDICDSKPVLLLLLGVAAVASMQFGVGPLR